MQSALLPNGKLVTANEYDQNLHGNKLLCIDPVCKVPVFFVPASQNVSAHFKTSGKGDSIHVPQCGFYKALSFEDSVAKVTEYQNKFGDNIKREIVLRVNLNSIDPDYEPTIVEHEKKDENEKKENQDIKIKGNEQPPKVISSLKAVKKLFTLYEPDILSSIMISIKGHRVPLSYLVKHYQKAHELLWADNLNQNLPYFVHGTIQKVIRREKVWYINFANVDSCYFSLVVFERHFKYFTYPDDKLIGKNILAYGYLKKNTFSENKQSTEMVIKSNKYIQFL